MSLASNISGLEDFDKKIAEANADFDKRKPKRSGFRVLEHQLERVRVVHRGIVDIISPTGVVVLTTTRRHPGQQVVPTNDVVGGQFEWVTSRPSQNNHINLA